MKKYVYTWGGLKTIGGRNGRRFCISYLGKCIDGWKEFYGEANSFEEAVENIERELDI